MSTEAWKLEKDLCRCCHAEGSFHNLAEPRYKLGEEEVYSEMLRYSFDVNLSPVTGLLCSMTFTICESCILRLRDATNFKRQVLMCEDRFKDMYSNVMKALNPGLHPTFEVKVESSNVVTQEEIKEEYLQLSDNDDTFDVEMSVDEDDDDDDKTVLQVKLDNAKKAKAKAKAKPKPKVKILPEKKTVRPKKKTEKTETAAKAEDKPKKDGDLADQVVTVKKFKFGCLKCHIVLDDIKSLNDHDRDVHRKNYTPKNKNMKSDGVIATDQRAPTESSEIPVKYTPPTATVSRCPTKIKQRKKIELNYHNRKRLLSKHGMKQLVETDRVTRYICGLCKKVFFTEYGFRKHMANVHMQAKCPDCSEMVIKSKMMLHRNKEHGAPIPTCGICGFKNPIERLVVQHQRKVHLNEKNVSCPHCDKTFFNNTNLRNHLIVHGAEKKYECSYCHKKFPRHATWKLHVKIHTGEKNKVCTVCGDRFVQKASLSYHMTKHHPEAC